MLQQIHDGSPDYALEVKPYVVQDVRPDFVLDVRPDCAHCSSAT